MISKENLYGVVVWYNPTEDNIKCIDSYIENLSSLIIIDNSDKDNTCLVPKDKRVIYVPNLENKGIAYALNQGCHIAIEHHAEWLLTMDQDSSFDKGDLGELINYANNYSAFENVGIFSPIQHYRKDKAPLKRKEEMVIYESMFAIMTSGNLLSLKHYQQTRGFNNDFFIDCVDDEYCCQLRKLNTDIIRINKIKLCHHLGQTKILHLGFSNKEFIEHSPIRRYYIMRNNLYLKVLYPETKRKCNRTIRKSIKRVLLYDWKDKCQKLKMMYWGWYDFRHSIQGPFKH